MNAIHKRRLLTLADNLERFEEYQGYEWDFNDYRTKNCKSTACAVGRAAMMWPRYWKWIGRDTIPVLRNGKEDETFFGITEDENTALFQPIDRRDLRGSLRLPNVHENLSREEVAANIRALVEMRAS